MPATRLTRVLLGRLGPLGLLGSLGFFGMLPGSMISSPRPLRAASGGEGRPARPSARLLPAARSEVPWASHVFAAGELATGELATGGDGGGAASSSPLVAIQTHYDDPVDGSVVLLVWDPTSGITGGVTVILDGESIGTILDPAGLAFVVGLAAGEHTFRIEGGGDPGFAEAAIRVLEMQPFDDPASLSCLGTAPGEDGGCDVELGWTNGPRLPSYSLVLLDDDVVARTATEDAENLTIPNVGPGRRAWTLIGYLEAVAGSPEAIYRGAFVGATCQVSCPDGPRFIRGSCDGSGEATISSPIFLLNYLYMGGLAPPCLEACDADADLSLNLTDAIYVLNFLFMGGPSPPGWTSPAGGGNGTTPTCESTTHERCAVSTAPCAGG